MSFQDVHRSGERRRQHPIFDNHRHSSSGPGISITPKTSSSKNNQRMILDMATRAGMEQSSSNRRNSKSSKTTTSNSGSKKQRGVRPRLSTTCPVTAKNLLGDDHDSMSTQETIETSSQEDSDNPAILPIRSKRDSPKSVFAHLTTSIVNFQKMVAELERLMDDAGTSPEIQWRTRILIRSAQDANRDIHKRLQTVTGGSSSALRKLQRDFDRGQTNLAQVLQTYHLKQQAEVSLFTADATKEEFFDRAMREREQEVQKIQKSMNQVNTIYQDLAAMVDGQQDQIDQIAERVGDSKSNTKAGLHSVRNGFFSSLLCVPDESIVLDELKHEKEGHFRVNEDFKWTMPFETLGDDMRSVQADVFRCGRDVVDDLHDRVPVAKLLESGCSDRAFECQEQFDCKAVSFPR